MDAHHLIQETVGQKVDAQHTSSSRQKLNSNRRNKLIIYVLLVVNCDTIAVFVAQQQESSPYMQPKPFLVYYLLHTILSVYYNNVV